jgi:hypothetical protein
MHRRTLDIHQEEANISNLFFAPLMIHDLPTYLKMCLATSQTKSST